MEKPGVSLHLSAAIRKAANQHPEEKNYWLTRLGGDLQKSRFPRDHQVPPQEKGTKTVTFNLSGAVFSTLSALDRGDDYILHVYMAASLAALLARYTGNTDILISTPIYRQDTREELINTILVLRNRVIPGMTFKQLLRQVRDTITGAEQNQNYPIELAAEHLHLLPGPGDDFPLFDTAVLVESIHDPAYLRRIRHNINFSFRREERCIKGRVDYNTGQYREAAVRRIATRFQQLLAGALSNLDAGVSDIDILTAVEKKQLLEEFNNTAVDYPDDKTLPGLFRQQAARTPDRVALVGSRAALPPRSSTSSTSDMSDMSYMSYISYNELNQTSDRRADLLKDKGVRSDTIVGLMVERSVEMIIGIMAILKAGGAYLPIDPEYPEDRIDYMLTDSGATLLVTDNDLEELPNHLTSQLPGFNLLPITSLAYVIYTSGTTGRPKGVMIEHRSLVNFIKGITAVIDFRPEDCILSLTTLGFDIFGLETFVPLTRGARVVIGTHEQQVDPAAAARVMDREGVTIFQVTPSRLQLFLSLREAAKSLVSLGYLLVGGEAFPGPLLAETRSLVRGKIFNLYGPTETTIWSAVKDLSGPVPLNLGKPIANTQIYVVDSRLKLLPIGVAGEIHLGGHGLARGYLNNLELTHERFVTIFNRSYRSYKSYIIYKTGDLGRWLEHGDLEFLGRIDHQVKIRGFRIELGEIENRLVQHENLKKTVVIDKVGAAGDKYLCAYYVLNSPGRDPGAGELREYLERGLPGYMVPSYFIRLEEIPLTFSGKIDRKALPAPGGKSGQGFTAPRDELEERLAVIWAEVLSEVTASGPGIDDNFFHLGGHSLNAIILVSKLYKALAVNLPLGELFKTPTIRGLSRFIRGAETAAFVPIAPVEKREYYPLSSAQKRLYFLDRAYEGKLHYNMPVVLRLAAKIHREKLERTYKSLIRRHESLRTSFVMVEEKPVQRIEEDAVIGFWSLVAAETETSEINEIIRDFIRPFDLSKAPLLRLGLVELAEDQYIFLLDMHHIISDGVSQALLIKEFTSLYRGDNSESLERLPLQYKDYTCWQESKKEKERIKKQETYWKSEFTGEIPVLELPYDYPRPAVQGFAGETMGFLLEEKESEGLRQLARQAQATLFMVVFSIFNILLAKLSGQEDIVIGTPVAARGHPDLEHIIGLFINTLPLRNYLPGEKPVGKFLEEVKNRSLKAFENQEYPLAELVDLVVTGRDQARNPIFDVLFALQNLELPKIEIPGLRLSPFPFKTNISKFDLALNTMEIGKRLSFNLEYRTGLFSAAAIQRWLTYFKIIIGAVIEDPTRRLADLEIMTAEEKAQVLIEFNETGTAYPADKTIRQLFRDQVGQTPDHVALVGPLTPETSSPRTGMTHISYRQLDEKAGRLAGILQGKGVLPDTVVGLRAERSTRMITGILGILKAGGAYLLLDPEYPPERRDYLLKDSGAKLLVTTNNLEELPNFLTSQLPNFHLSPATSLAYIIYTSGSTGRPKGVMVGQQNVIRLVKNPDYIDLHPRQGLLMTGSPVFDITTFEIWASLLNGLRLYLVDKETVMDVTRLAETVVKNNIAVLHLIPQLFSQVWEHSPGAFAHLEYFLVGGDLVQPGPVNRLRNSYPHLKILHCYGPTENTTFSTALTMEKTYDVRLPIGKPIRNSSIYILDKYGQLQPIGVTGEIYAGGDGVARGYLNQPELTAERFCRRRQKLYKTGDLGRWLPEGNIEFLGRIDHQVKIRGHRIEPAEIESRLLKHRDIKAAVVMMKHSLCAYTVSDRDLDRDDLREYLSRHLPGYMIPDFFVRLEKIPLTPNGKVDRNALAEPGAREILHAYEAPGNEVEKKLAEVWSQVLGERENREIGINENFFQLGGDSINAIQVCARLRKYGLDLKINDLFSHPVISELAKCVKKIQREIGQGMVTGEVPLTPVQQYFFRFQSKPGYYHHFNQAVMLFAERGYDEGKLTRIFTRLVRHHDALRTVFQFNREKIFQTCKGPEGKLFDLEVFNFTGKEQEIQKKIETAANRTQAGIDLENGPLVKLALFKTPGGDHLFIVIHHLVIDGISWRILLEDFLTGSRQLEQGKEIRFPGKTDSFKYWAEKLSEYASHPGNNDRELQYWQAVETKGAQAAHLPRDYELPEEKKKAEYLESVSLRLNPEETTALLQKVNRAYNTEINHLLLTALGMAVNRWAGLERVVVDLEGHGREPIGEDIDIDRTLGWFSSRYPVILDIKQSQDISFTLRSVKETLRRVPGKGIGYGILEYLSPSDRKNGLTFALEPEIAFNYLGQFGPWGEAEGQGEAASIRFSRFSTGKSTGPETNQTHTLTINGMVTGGELILSFSYNTHEYDESTIRALVDLTAENLSDIIRHCTQALQNREPVLTPSDVADTRYLELSLEKFSQITQYIESKIPGKPAIQSIYSLSPMQQGMLYHALTGRDEDVYFNQYVFRLAGAVQSARLEASFNKLVERYDIFRTIFLYEGLEKPLQVVLKHRTTRVRYEDLSGLQEERQRLYLEEAAKKDKAGGFDLSKDLPMRLRLFRVSERSYRLLWSHHHIRMDGWCMGIIYNELTRIYEGLTRARPVQLGDVTPYGNYIAWLERQDKPAGLHYWENYLEGYEQPAGLPVPGQEKSKNEKGYQIKEWVLELGAAETDSLNRLAGRCRVTINTVFQALWGILLQKYNNSDDVVFGAVVSGRPAEIKGIENMVGLFINTVPVRIKTRPGLEFAGLLRNLRENNTTSRSFEYLPLAEIQAKSRLKGNLIDHIMIFENYPFHEQIKSTANPAEDFILDFNVEGVEIYERSNYNFNVILIPGAPPTPFLVKFGYNASVYDEDFIKPVALHLKEILRQVKDEPGLKIESIEIITREEKNRVLFDFNRTAADYPGDRCLQQLFAGQVEQTPDRVAIAGPAQGVGREAEGAGATQFTVCDSNQGDAHITYDELNKKSNSLARVLVEKGIGTDTPVGLRLPRSVEMIIAILGILKAGGAYLPLDPDYPEKRIGYMLKDSDARFLLTAHEITAFSQRRTFNFPTSPLPHFSTSTPASLAYILYTSGTTGKPKAVMVTHQNVVRLVKNTNFIEFNEKERILPTGALEFDASTFEIWGALLNGLTLYQVAAGTLLAAGGLKESLGKYDIGIMWMTAPLFNQVLQADIGIFKGLKYLLVGGDVLSPYHINRLKQEFPNLRVINGYGPTENTTFSTTYRVDREYRENIPIGKPIANSTAYIVDRNGKLQPPGVTGELWVGGDGVARGYLNNPELTHEKFDHDLDYHDKTLLREGPDDSRGGFLEKSPPGRRRLYKTGDLARWLKDGNIEFLGRADEQVKIRGFRIEVSEIERNLLAHESIREAVVVVKKRESDRSGLRHLCAYIVTTTELAAAHLKEHLARHLPGYMIPSYFILIDKIPLTANGKVDREALPEPEIKAGEAYIAPRNKVEEQLEEIWCRLLGVKKGVIGIDRDFFELGGHSLKATAMATDIYETFHVSLALAEIFKNPTIRAIASLIKVVDWINIPPENRDHEGEEIII